MHDCESTDVTPPDFSASRSLQALRPTVSDESCSSQSSITFGSHITLDPFHPYHKAYLPPMHISSHPTRRSVHVLRLETTLAMHVGQPTVRYEL